MFYQNNKGDIVQAEQFDGSDRMIQKYNINATRTAFIFQCIMMTKYGPTYVYKHDWIITDENGEHWTVQEDEFPINYKKYDDKQ